MWHRKAMDKEIVEAIFRNYANLLFKNFNFSTEDIILLEKVNFCIPFLENFTTDFNLGPTFPLRSLSYTDSNGNQNQHSLNPPNKLPMTFSSVLTANETQGHPNLTDSIRKFLRLILEMLVSAVVFITNLPKIATITMCAMKKTRP